MPTRASSRTSDISRAEGRRFIMGTKGWHLSPGDRRIREALIAGEQLREGQKMKVRYILTTLTGIERGKSVPRGSHKHLPGAAVEVGRLSAREWAKMRRRACPTRPARTTTSRRASSGPRRSSVTSGSRDDGGGEPGEPPGAPRRRVERHIARAVDAAVSRAFASLGWETIQ